MENEHKGHHGHNPVAHDAKETIKDHENHHDHHTHSHGLKEKGKEELNKTETKIDNLTLHGHEKAIHSKKMSHHDHSQMAHGNPTHGEAGHDHHAMMIDDFKKRFWISIVLSIPVIILSHMIQEILGYHLTFPGADYFVFAVSSVIFFYGGWPFLKGMVDEIKGKSIGMMTLIGLAISVAYIYSTAVVFGLKGMDFYWELATLICNYASRPLAGNEINIRGIQST